MKGLATKKESARTRPVETELNETCAPAEAILDVKRQDADAAEACAMAEERQHARADDEAAEERTGDADRRARGR